MALAATSSTIPLIPELLRLICEEVGSDKSSLAALAASCRAFEEPALDVLWSKLDNFYHLAMCLPEAWRVVDTRYVNGVAVKCVALKLRKGPPLVAAAIERFATYGKRVRCLTFQGSHHATRRVDVTVLQGLQIVMHGTSVVPNIRKLTWNCSEWNYFPFIPLFLGQHLEGVQFHFHSGDPSQQMALLPMLCDNHPALKNVALLYNTSEDTLSFEDITTATRYMSSSLYKWKNLESLTIQNVSYAAMRGLSLLHSLKYLEVRQWKPDAHATGIQRGGFPALDNLKLGCYSVTECIAMLELMDGTPLCSLAIWFRAIEDGYSWTRIFTVLRDHCRHETIRDIQCFDGMSFRTGVPFNLLIPPDNDDVFNYQAIETLLVFRELRLLHIEVARGFYFTNPGITKEMAESWKKIRHLSFSLPRGCCPQRQSAIGIADLLPFAVHCPCLKKLGIFIDGRNPPPISHKERPGNGVSQMALAEMDVGNSTASFPSKIAAFLSSCFPQLRIIRARNCPWDLQHGIMLDNHNEEVWRQVQELISDFSAVRMQERSNPVIVTRILAPPAG